MNFIVKKNARSELSVVDTQSLLLDLALAISGLKTDKELAKLMKVSAASISKIRNKHVCIGSTIFLRVHEITEIRIPLLREVLDGKYGESIFQIMQIFSPANRSLCYAGAATSFQNEIRSCELSRATSERCRYFVNAGAKK